MLTRKALAEVPSSKARAQRRTNGTRRRAAFCGGGGGASLNDVLIALDPLPTEPTSTNLHHHAIGTRSPGDLFPVQVLEQRDHVLSAQARQLLELPHVQ